MRRELNPLESFSIYWTNGCHLSIRSKHVMITESSEKNYCQMVVQKRILTDQGLHKALHIRGLDLLSQLGITFLIRLEGICNLFCCSVIHIAIVSNTPM